MSNLAIWNEDNNLQEIKKMFAPKFSDLEFKTFVEMGKFTGLNPFLKEIWAVKYDEKAPAQIFIGRDGYRKSAQRHQQYDYHYVEAVYSGDEFNGENGIYIHKFNLKDRGILVGAYCNVYRKDSPRPFSLFVELKEYYKGQSVWKDKPATMIKKVAEAQCLRMAFQELFGGTYDDSENWIIDAESSKDKESAKSNHGKSTSLQVPKLPSGTPNYLNFGESIEDKIHLKKLVVGIALDFGIDPVKDEELIKEICRDVLSKNPTLDNLNEIIKQTFDEHLRVNE